MKMKDMMKKRDFQSLWERYSTVVLLAVLIIMFNLVGEGFWSWKSYQNIVLGNTGLIVIVIGLSFVMIGGGIDLSIGYQISLIAVIISLLSTARFPDWVVILGALVTGICCGLLNGVLVGFLEIVPFAATIATQVVFRGIAFVLSNGRMVSYIAEKIRAITRHRFLWLRIDVWIVLAGVFALWAVLRFFFMGKYLRAIGLNESTAIRAGIKVKKVKCLSYCVAGLFYAVAAMILVSRKGYAGSEIGVGMEITAIVAAYVGGILNMAEKQSVITLLLGTLVVAVIETGLTKYGMNTAIQYIITGVILIVSMTIHKKRK